MLYDCFYQSQMQKLYERLRRRIRNQGNRPSPQRPGMGSSAATPRSKTIPATPFVGFAEQEHTYCVGAVAVPVAGDRLVRRQAEGEIDVDKPGAVLILRYHAPVLGRHRSSRRRWVCRPAIPRPKTTPGGPVPMELRNRTTGFRLAGPHPKPKGPCPEAPLVFVDRAGTQWYDV